MTDVLFVAGEPPWPSCHGGRLRAARLAQALGQHLEVRVAAPAGAPPPPSVGFDELPDEVGDARLRAIASPRPRLGRAALGPRRSQALEDLARRHRPRVVLFARSYLAACAPHLGLPTAVDFADVECRRMPSLAGHGPPRRRLALAWEAAKARRWERAVARHAAVVAAPTPGDVGLLSRWGATAVLVPHGADPCPLTLSPAQGPVVFAASFAYLPNRDAARWLVDRVWPVLRRLEPALRLRLVGWRAGDALGWTGAHGGVEVVADPASMDEHYRQAALVVAPVASGGGAQLKITEALARHRVVVATSFSARSAPPGSPPGALAVADDPSAFATAVVRLWRSAGDRWARERALAGRQVVPTWDEACAPFAAALARLAASPLA